MDTTTFQDAVRALLEAADTATAAVGSPPAGEWNAEQILAHVSLVNAATIATAAAVTAGAHTTYDNRMSQDPWTIGRTIGRAGGSTGLRERIRLQGVALDALSGAALSAAELDTQVPALLRSGDVVLVDQPVTLRDILGGLAEVELPGHAQQLLALI